MKHERCVSCDELTGRAGKGEDSLYSENGDGPFCESCFENYQDASVEQLRAKLEYFESVANERLKNATELQEQLAAAQERIAELEGRTCDRCGKYYECNQQRVINTIRRDYHTDYYLSVISGCSEYEPKKEDKQT